MIKKINESQDILFLYLKVRTNHNMRDVFTSNLQEKNSETEDYQEQCIGQTWKTI